MLTIRFWNARCNDIQYSIKSLESKRGIMSRVAVLFSLLIVNLCFAESEQLEIDDLLQESISANEANATPKLHVTRILRNVQDQPEAITTITANDISRWGIVNTVDIFRYIPGFRVTRRGYDITVSYHGSSQRVSRSMEIVLDNRSVFDLATLPILASDIASIIVLRGPNGSNYGSNAYVVSVNIKTKSFHERKNGIVYTSGENNTRIANLFLNGKGKRYSYSITGSEDRGNGYDKLDDSDEEYPDDYLSKRYYGTLVVEPTPNLSLDINYSYLRHQNEFPLERQFIEAALADLKNQAGSAIATYLVKENQSIELHVLSKKEKKKAELEGCYPQITFSSGLSNLARINQPLAVEVFGGLSSSFSGIDSEAITDEENIHIAQVVNDISQYGDEIFDDICGITSDILQSDLKTVEFLHRFSGANLETVLGASLSDFNIHSSTIFSSGDVELIDRRLFYDNQYRTESRKFTFSAGVMYETAKLKPNDAFSWRASGSSHLSNSSTIRLTISKSEKQPSVINLFRDWTNPVDFEETNLYGTTQGVLPIFSQGNEKLQNEVLNSYSLGYLFNEKETYFDLKVFYNLFESPLLDNLNLLEPVIMNAEEYTIKGAEFTFKRALTASLGFISNYSYLDANEETQLLGRHQGSVIFDYQLSPQQSLSIAYVGNSPIAGHSYDRYDVIFLDRRRFGRHNLNNRLVFSRHIGGIDGRGVTASPDGSFQSRYDDLNHLFYSIYYEFN